MRLHAIGFGALNLDEFWEVPAEFLSAHGLRLGEEYVRDEAWFHCVYPSLAKEAEMKALDPGGSAANAMAALRRMGFHTGFYGATGGDGVSSLRLGELGSEDDLRIRITPHPAGRCLALIDRDDHSKDRSLVILPNANDLAGSGTPDITYFEQARWVHMTSFVSPDCLRAQTEVARQLARTTRLSFDPGAVYCRLGLDRLSPILRRTDVLFVTEDELEVLTHEKAQDPAAGILFEIGVSIVVIKMGDRGIMAVNGHGSIRQPAVKPALVKDRTGAGDVAAAGFLAGMILSMDLKECLHLAALCASRSIEGYGRSTYPDRAFVETFLKDREIHPSRRAPLSLRHDH
ncbi:MAG: carbohydrate kinase family protein [Desulfomonilaceae bacterium]|nr:carbohydrate kinase family protein [Desulfomonilaceae bacterium]